MMKVLRLLFLCTMLLTSAGAATQGSDVVYRIGNETVHSIDARLFGQFMERPSWGEIGPEGALIPGTNILQPEVNKLIHQMKIPILRFPGGTDVDFMDWCDMVSNVPGREAERPVSTGHTGKKVTNRFGYDEFLRLCDDLKSQAVIVVNFRDALLKEKPMEEAALKAADLVAYCNAPLGAKLPEGMPDWQSVRAGNGHPEPYGVKYWQIGNETWAFFKELKELVPREPEKYYAQCVTAFVRAMLAVDPTIEFIIDGHGPTLGAARLARKQLRNKIRYLVFHVYKPWGIREVKRDGKTVPVESLSAADIWNAWTAVPDFDEQGLAVMKHQLLMEARNEGFRIAVTEWNWNGWWSNQPAALSSSFAKGIGAAGLLHALMRSAYVIDIGCQSMLVGNSWKIHAIHADRNGKTSPYYMPSGQLTAFYSQHHGSRMLDMQAAGVPVYTQPFEMNGIKPCKKVAYLDALATADEKTVFFHVINRRFERAIKITIDLTAQEPLTGKAQHYILAGRLNDKPARGEPVQIGKITNREISYDGKTLEIVLPARTVSCIEFPRNR
ncbi:alpha-L-arabinofuranosidase C-terminal domain-containing protein [candidate division KSB1 bacterium]